MRTMNFGQEFSARLLSTITYQFVEIEKGTFSLDKSITLG